MDRIIINLGKTTKRGLSNYFLEYLNTVVEKVEGGGKLHYKIALLPDFINAEDGSLHWNGREDDVSLTIRRTGLFIKTMKRDERITCN